ncbi:unnamed protein product [Adineta ricciae]|uniref:Uncharacterized protein n=1 Tax=Adineta ricciae TaxID=249248 RepID=A0A815MSM2_ADIRI|nr:unnamed protein product [Adineta ricciae]CAF1422321.1 unnamed protein product [Adineta ricciae]
MTQSSGRMSMQRCFIYFLSIGGSCLFIIFILFRFTSPTISFPIAISIGYRRRPECLCLRPELTPNFTNNTSPSYLCSTYAAQRGTNQRIISISLFGPKENRMFQLNRSLTFLNELINDMNVVYSDGFVLRVHHDDTIGFRDVICPFECQHPNVDFCSMSSKLYIPPKIWRFIPAGDPLVDIMMSRDLDSALTPRERSSVDAWLASNKSFHAMRDHPMHGVPMLGGMWGFRPASNPELRHMIHKKVHQEDLVRQYGGRGDQTFLAQQVWPHAKSDILVHDSFLCKHNYGQKPSPFPTQRRSANETNCFVGCVRPCCGRGKMPFGECPIECRPKDHPEWNYC